MPRLRRIIMSLLLAALASAGTANATTITVNTTGPSPTTGTATTGIQLTFNTAGRTLNCTSGEFTTTTMSTVTGTAPLRFGTITPVLPSSGGSCTITGGVAVNIACLPGDLYAWGPRTRGDVTEVWVPGMSCVVAVTGAASCRANFNGSANGAFDNLVHQLTVYVIGQRLIVSGSTTGLGGTCAVLPNDASMTLSRLSGGSLVFQYPRTKTIIVP
jgi:hypothetical protein